MKRLITELKVRLDFGSEMLPVGRLAIRDHTIYFEYEASFIQRGLEISPLRLPLKTGVTAFETRPFEGLAGVFSDSLPDGWGRLLFDRLARSQNTLPSDVTPLDRLAYAGFHGMGALVYEPENPNAFSDLWDWYARWSSGEMPHWKDRRVFIREMYSELLKNLQSADQTLDGVKASKTDAKRMLDAYIAVELGGSANENLRKYARASNDLANELTHKRTANKKDASLCASATISLVNAIGILENRH